MQGINTVNSSEKDDTGVDKVIEEMVIYKRSQFSKELLGIKIKGKAAIIVYYIIYISKR